MDDRARRPDQFVSLEQAAAWFRVPLPWVMDLVEGGEIPVIRAGDGQPMMTTLWMMSTALEGRAISLAREKRKDAVYQGAEKIQPVLEEMVQKRGRGRPRKIVEPPWLPPAVEIE